MYIPKKLKWDSLESFVRHLENDTKEKIVKYDGGQIITETTRYGLCLGELSCRPIVVEKKTRKKKSTT